MPVSSSWDLVLTSLCMQKRERTLVEDRMHVEDIQNVIAEHCGVEFHLIL